MADREPAAPAPPAARRSLQASLLAILAGVLLAVLGAGRPWVSVSGRPLLSNLSGPAVATVSLSGNDLAPLSALALLGLALVVAVAMTRGRGRWLVGVALLAVAAVLLAQAAGAARRAPAEAEARLRRGALPGLPAAFAHRTSTATTGPGLVIAGGALLALAGVETLRQGRRWPALGDAFRAPPDRGLGRDRDRAATPAADEEPPWEEAP
jgi:uncharacterized membrane protein (TIGR02234 family)